MERTRGNNFKEYLTRTTRGDAQSPVSKRLCYNMHRQLLQSLAHLGRGGKNEKNCRAQVRTQPASRPWETSGRPDVMEGKGPQRGGWCW